MATTYIVGPHMSEIVQMTSADTLKLRLLLTDAANPLQGLTGVTFDAAGMTVSVAKPGADFATFPTFDTNNWHEVGNGWYELIIRGSDATELALLDTVGSIQFYVMCTASNQAHLARKIVPADVARDDQVTDARMAKIDTGVAADIVKLLGTALPAESVAGRDAAAFGKLLDVATPVLTAESVNQSADNDTKLTTIAADVANVDGWNPTTALATLLSDYARRTGDYNTVVPDVAGTAATLLGLLQTHGDLAWATAVGFELAGAATAALASYDPPTNAEMIARTRLAAEYALEGTLTAMKGTGFSVTDTLEAIRDALTAAGVALTAQGVADALKLAPSAGDPAPGSVNAHLDDMPGDVAAQITTDHGVGSYVSEVTGAYTITLTLYETATTTPIPDVTIALQTSGGAYVDAAETNAAGQVVFARDAGAYKLIPRSTPWYDFQGLTGGAWAVTVVDANLVPIKYATPIAIPAATEPDQCALWDDVLDEDGTVSAAGQLTVTVLAVHNADDMGEYVQDWVGATATNNALGRWTLNLSRGLVCTLKVVGEHYVRTWKITVPDAVSQQLSDADFVKKAVA